MRIYIAHELLFAAGPGSFLTLVTAFLSVSLGVVFLFFGDGSVECKCVRIFFSPLSSESSLVLISTRVITPLGHFFNFVVLCYITWYVLMTFMFWRFELLKK